MVNDPVFLVIDDDAVFARIMCRSLTQRGYHCFIANDGETASVVLQQQPVTRVLLDLRLADESGVSLIQSMLEQSPLLRIVVMTGYASLATAVQAIKLGAWDYLAKPVTIDVVLKAFEGEVSDSSVNVERLKPTSLKQLEWEHLQRVLSENDGNISVTARQLNMHRRTLQRKLQKKTSQTSIDEE